MAKNPNQGRMVTAHTLLALSGLSFLLAGILWLIEIEGTGFDVIGGVGAVGTGCYLIILALKKRR
jgi:hypothetical protein